MDVGYVWDQDKYEKTKKKHNLTFAQVVSALEDPKGFEYSDEVSWEEERWLWIGKTTGGRYLLVVFTDEDSPLIRIITAFDAEERWVEQYEERT